MKDDFSQSTNNETALDKVRRPKDGIIEIILLFFVPFFGFLKIVFDLYIIKYLSVFHLLFPTAIFQFFKDIIIIFYKIIKNQSDKIQFIQFIFTAISDITAIIGFAIYLELIVLKFCGYDENTKDNITLRSIIDTNESFEYEDERINENNRDSLLEEY